MANRIMGGLSFRLLRLPGALLLAILFLPAVCSWVNPSKLSADPVEERKARADFLQKLRQMMARLRPLHSPIHRPGPDDWLANHPERGQTFSQYLARKPRPITLNGSSPRQIIYIQPIGEFTPTQRKIVGLTARFMALYFNTTVKVAEDLYLWFVPPQAQRASRGFGRQLLTVYLLEEVLRPRLAPDAAACIAFTAEDLFPQDSWNFVFGQASLHRRVGVWSLARYGDPDASPAAFRLCLLRTLKVATHETGHMFSMSHCTAYQCNMNGSNNLQESDQKPLGLCPECQAKLCWATHADPVEGFRKLAEFCKAQGLRDEQVFYEESLQALQVHQ